MNKPTTIIHFVRHGLVENPSSIRYGRLPGIHLNEEGRRHIESLGAFFIKRSIRTIYASPLERTQQTATLLGLALPTVPIILDARLLEVKIPPKFEGKSDHLGFSYPIKPAREAETPNQILDRMAAFVEEKVIAFHDQEIIAVSHGDPIALYRSQAVFGDDKTINDPYPNYGSISSFVYRGLDVVESWYTDTLADKVR
jgi:broad specificity phosphatase PhoE